MLNAQTIKSTVIHAKQDTEMSKLRQKALKIILKSTCVILKIKKNAFFLINN